jgi:twinkle protein
VDLTEKLLQHGIRLKDYTAGEHVATCPQCSPTRRKSNLPCLSVKVDEQGGATWYCQHCSWKGNVPSGGHSLPPRRVYKRPVPPKETSRTSQLVEWFKRRGISEETVEAFGIHVSRKWFPALEAEADCIAFPYLWKGELVNAKYRTRTQDGGKTFAQESDAEPTLFNIDNLAQDEVIFTEGEMDVLALWEAGYRSVVTVPNGAGQGERRLEPLKTHDTDLKNVKKVIIATDSDEPGCVLAEALASSFGKDRCWRVTFPDGCKDPNEVLMKHGRDGLVRCISEAQPWPIDGVYAPRTFRENVLDLYYGRVAKPLTTGIPGMDEFWKVMPHSFNVITGIPNHGKSNFLDQVAVNMARLHGWNFAVFSPEHSPARHIARLSEKLIGRPFYDGPSIRMAERDVEEAIEWIDRHFMFIESKEAAPSVDWLIERFKWAALRCDMRGVIIDPYNEVEASRPSKQTETEFVSELISKLKRFGIAHDVAVFMVVHPAKLQRDKDGKEPVPSLYDLHGSAHWRNKCDAGVVVHRDFEQDITEIWIRKIREQPVGGSIGKVALKFDAQTRQYRDAPQMISEAAE